MWIKTLKMISWYSNFFIPKIPNFACISIILKHQVFHGHIKQHNHILYSLRKHWHQTSNIYNIARLTSASTNSPDILRCGLEPRCLSPPPPPRSRSRSWCLSGDPLLDLLRHSQSSLAPPPRARSPATFRNCERYEEVRVHSNDTAAKGFCV